MNAPAGVPHHVVSVPGMSDATAGLVVDRILESPSPHLDVEFRGGEPLSNQPVLRGIVKRLRERSRGTGRRLSLSLSTNLSGMTTEACDWLVDSDLLVTVAFDGPREAHDANRALTGAPAHDVAQRWLRELHARHEKRGVTREAAYVNAVVTVADATLAAGAQAVVDACVGAGLVYVQLRPSCSPAEFLAFYRDAARLIVARNEAGTLLVEKRLALHLETLSTIDPRRAPRAPASAETLAYDQDGRVYLRRRPIGDVQTHRHDDLARRALDQLLAEPRSSGCETCPYDPYCGTTLLRRYIEGDDVATRSFGTDWCKMSMGTFDGIFEVLRSSDGATLRRVNKRWMEARDRVAARLRGVREHV